MDIVLDREISITTPWCLIDDFDPYASSLGIKEIQKIYEKDGNKYIELCFFEQDKEETKEYKDIINNTVKI